jgi:hypothetical protein
MRKQLHLQVNGGLCSRMRAVLGGMAYCLENRRDLIVDWGHSEPNFGHNFQANLKDLWELPSWVTETDEGIRFPKDDSVLKSGADFIKLRTCHIEPFLEWMGYGVKEYMDILHPTNRVRNEMKKVPASKFNVGVHIRYSVKQPGAATPEWTINRMQQLRDINKDCAFFLSADNEYVSSMVSEAFPDIYELDKSYRYDFMGIVRSAADWMILKDVDWLLGSNFSSYSQLLAMYRGAEYLGSHDKPNGLDHGGNYEDMWNTANHGDVLNALR